MITINYFNRVLCALMLCAGLVVTGCYDDSALLGQIGKLDSRVTELERLTAQQNTNLESLQTIVNALQENDYVTSVAPINEGETIIGYTITFSKSGNVTIYHGKDGADGADGAPGQNGSDGKDGYVPAMGVKQDESDSQWYWTVDGEWMMDSEGKRVRASATDGEDGEDGNQGETGVTPQLKIMDGYWYVSYDGGKTWEEESLGQATGDNGNCIFTDVSCDDEFVYFELVNGEQFKIPFVQSLELVLNVSQIECVPGGTAEVEFSLTGCTSEIAVNVISEGGYVSSVEKNGYSGSIKLKAGEDSAGGKLLIIISYLGQTIFRELPIIVPMERIGLENASTTKATIVTNIETTFGENLAGEQVFVNGREYTLQYDGALYVMAIKADNYIVGYPSEMFEMRGEGYSITYPVELSSEINFPYFGVCSTGESLCGMEPASAIIKLDVSGVANCSYVDVLTNSIPLCGIALYNDIQSLDHSEVLSSGDRLRLYNTNEGVLFAPVIPATWANGLSVVLYDSNGQELDRKTLSKAVTVERAKILYFAPF